MSVRRQTHQRVLPQPAALESVSVDKGRVPAKRGTDAGQASARPASGVQHGRGETAVSAAASRGRGGSAAVAGGNSSSTHTKVAVLDKRGRPLDPCHPARARELLRKDRAVVVRWSPFVIRLKERMLEQSTVHRYGVKIDPGSKTTGLAVVRENEATDEVTTHHQAVWLGELVHRGLQIKAALQKRAALRRSRRSRNLRYRAPRFSNRTRKPGWLPPSLQHRVDTIRSWVDRFSRWYPLTSVWVESVRFDMQKMQNPEISGVEYQQGTLAGFEVREYLLEKWGRTCVYCDATDTPLNIDHVHPRSKGGSDRVSNLVLACVTCNQKKDSRPVEEFVTNKARLARIKRQMRTPLRDAAAVNATRRELYRAMQDTGLAVHAGTGAHTKWNRTRLGVPKTHALDALCVGCIDTIGPWPEQTQVITTTGRGSYSRTRSDKYGFPRLRLTRTKRHHGFQTGDHVRAVVPTGKKTGTYTGRVAVRATGSFNVTTTHGIVQGVNHKHVRLIQRADGYGYDRKETATA